MTNKQKNSHILYNGNKNFELYNTLRTIVAKTYKIDEENVKNSDEKPNRPQTANFYVDKIMTIVKKNKGWKIVGQLDINLKNKFYANLHDKLNLKIYYDTLNHEIYYNATSKAATLALKKIEEFDTKINTEKTL